MDGAAEFAVMVDERQATHGGAAERPVFFDQIPLYRSGTMCSSITLSSEASETGFSR